MVDFQLTVDSLCRFPVKSMGGEELSRVSIESRGVKGDRKWAVTFPDGKVASGKTWKHVRRIDGLLKYQATGNDPVTVETPDGERFGISDKRLNDQLSNAAGTPVRLQQEADGVSHFDIAPIHVLFTSELEQLERIAGSSAAARERYRANIVVSNATPNSPGNLSGRMVQIGDRVVLKFTEPTERCVMPTLEQPGIPADKRILTHLKDHSNLCLGYYATVVRTGEILLGDEVVLQ